MRRRAVWVLLLGAAAARAGADDDGETLMRAVIAQASARDEVVDLRMRLVDTNGKERLRTATLYMKKKGEKTGSEQDMRLIRFDTPPDLAGSGILSIEQPERHAEHWLYMPAYHASRRIATVNGGDTWMGTDFAYDDILDPRVRDHLYRVGREEKVGGVVCTELESTPRDPRNAPYAKRVYWIDRSRSVINRVEFYDRAGAHFKTLTNEELVRIGGRYRWRRGEMVNLRKRHRTLLEFSNWRIDEGLDDRHFTVRYLERGT
jgi:Outer membrane lipoprotein-sorting protein